MKRIYLALVSIFLVACGSDPEQARGPCSCAEIEFELGGNFDCGSEEIPETHPYCAAIRNPRK